MKSRGETVAPVAGWKTKREWVHAAFLELERAGYSIGSAYTAVRNPAQTRFLYRDLLWKGADLIGLGVASFSHVGGTHFQNEHEVLPYLSRIQKGQLPIYRALTTTPEERMIREFILQMKLGQVDTAYFQNKFAVDVRQRFARPLNSLQEQNLLTIRGDHLLLSRDGLLQVDKLLHQFFLPKHRNARYA
jgi:oxygen-independent coproporphyrinogen-3 oxidase